MRYDLVQLDSDEAKEELPDYYDSYDGFFRHALVVRDDDENIARVVDVDGGEPEDNFFARDWAWVPSELNRAYELGIERGYREALNEPE